MQTQMALGQAELCSDFYLEKYKADEHQKER